MVNLAIDGTSISGMGSIEYSEMAINTSKDQAQITTQNTDSPSSHGETRYSPKWAEWVSYYKTIPEFQQVINTLAFWALGKGIITDEKTEKTLSKIRGYGKDTFEEISENLIKSALICGDSFAEIIRDKAGRLINLKPLNPGSMVIKINEFGILTGYEQNGEAGIVASWGLKEIFHLSWGRIADEYHGIPFPEKLKEIILMIKECREDQKVLFHRYVKPITIIPVKTDDEAEINRFTTKYNNAFKLTENIIVPDEVVNTKEITRMSIPQNSVLDPMKWLEHLQQIFVTSCGVPEVIMGWARNTTEASGKVVYLAFEQTIRQIQTWFSQNVNNQLNLEIKLEFPASLVEELNKDERKDGSEEIKQKINPLKDERK
jgi:hypothetical protein